VKHKSIDEFEYQPEHTLDDQPGKIHSLTSSHLYIEMEYWFICVLYLLATHTHTHTQKVSR